MSSYGDFNRNLIEDLRAHHGRASSGPFQGRDVLILTTRGAKSGRTRENPLVYTRDGEDYVIVASKGGAPTHPSWYLNLREHPDVTVEVGDEKFEARARVIDSDEDYERLYHHHASVNPTFHDYRKKTTRKIPVVVLERAES
ncbi:MAG TPA: nitroreductase family deazaflavin-dependent oxidoreductase [Candidatus Dormibacteraeota bacterium]|nr:nitroreductase family deazaflavin-dependent oxidoreductase [Candidatus Dormibacteraeota bacterium]